MNSCDSHHDASQLNCSPINNGQREYPQPPSGNLFKNKLVEDVNSLNAPENHKKVSYHCLRSSGPPPRPFKKARYAWEIKNYDYTLKKMTQNVTHSENPSSDAESSVEKSQPQSEASNYSVNSGQTTLPNPVQEERTPDMHMIGPPHHQGYNMGLLSTSYHAHYGAVMGANLNHQNALSHDERLDTFHSQIPQDPDARLIRWHTRQLCRSIFDNTVNRMLENMGFSPVTDRSQALHPLLVLSLSDDEERESEEAHQRSLESQVLTAALHQKGFLPPPYHYDTLESATTSDYDSSEEDSELGEVASDELADQSALALPLQQNTEEDPYLHLNTHHHHPSLAHIVNKPVSYLSPHDPLPSLNHMPSETHQTFTPAQNLSDYRRDCDDNDSLLLNRNDLRENSDKSPKLGRQEPCSPQDSDKNECVSRCRSLECRKEQSNTESSYQKKLKLDDNENCIASPKQETTLIEGKVERVLDNCLTPVLAIDTNKNNENNNNNKDSSYFIRNAIHLAIKQQGLGFQRA